MKHNWKKNEDGTIDEFAFDRDGHNGVFCEDCGKSSCVHCDGYNYDDMDDCTGVKPRTVASVLLERYQNNIEAFASSRVVGKIVNGRSKFYCSQSKAGYDVLADAINAEIAYLNSPYTEGDTE